MNIINQSVQLIEKPEVIDRMSVLKYLEKIGRVCYKSEDRITDESCVKFIKMLRDRKHWAILEHFIFTFDVPKDLFDQMNQSLIELLNDYITGFYIFLIASSIVGLISAFDIAFTSTFMFAFIKNSV